MRGSFLQELTSSGLRVDLYDQQSMGESPRVRASVPYFFEHFDDLASDLLCVHAAVRTEAAAQPIFWMGMSMGGGVVARAAQLAPNLAAGVTLHNMDTISLLHCVTPTA